MRLICCALGISLSLRAAADRRLRNLRAAISDRIYNVLVRRSEMATMHAWCRNAANRRLHLGISWSAPELEKLRASTIVSTSSPTGMPSRVSTPAPPASWRTLSTTPRTGSEPESIPKEHALHSVAHPRHAELYLLLQMVRPSRAGRVPTYKEQMEQLADKDLSTLGFSAIRLLQTADVIMYDAHYCAGATIRCHTSSCRESGAAVP